MTMGWEEVAQALGVLGGLGVLGQLMGWVRRRCLTEEPGRLVAGVRVDPRTFAAFIDLDWAGDAGCWDVQLTSLTGGLVISGSEVRKAHLGSGETFSIPIVITHAPATATIRYRVHNHRNYRCISVDLLTGDVYMRHGPRSWRATGLPRSASR